VLSLLTAGLVGYLIGSIPAGYLVARLAGIDIRTVGSGSTGATNVVRALGRRYGYPVFLFDLLKGIVAVKASAFAHGNDAAWTLSPDLLGIVGGICSVIGHSYPIWLGFKGGKGVATSGGVVVALMPWVAIVAGLVWIIMFQSVRYVSVASIAAVLSIPVTAAILLQTGRLESALFYFSIAIAAIVVIRHRSNLSRLIHGKETRFERK
jgi:acyl phosphate:glycerol-3-phosphate acyltransferase